MLVRGTRNLVPFLGLVLLLCVIAALYRKPQLPSNSLDYLRKFGNGKTTYDAPSSPPPYADVPPFEGSAGSDAGLVQGEDPLHPDHKVANPNPIPGADIIKEAATTSSTTTRGVPAVKTADDVPAQPTKAASQQSVSFNNGVVQNSGQKEAIKNGQIPDNYWTKAPRRVVKSKRKPDGTYWKVKMKSYQGINPNIIPDPKYEDRYLVVAQQHQDTHQNLVWHTELTCRAKFDANGDMDCIMEPMVVPIALTRTDKCEGTDFPFITMNIGPHDARLFNGPDRPYMMWGAQSKHVCFGQWLQDYRPLIDWEANYTYSTVPKDINFELATDLQRPAPYGQVEKNWFMFWDKNNQTYLHYHVYPHRVFAQLSPDGSVGSDLAPAAYAHDEKCWAQHIQLAPIQDPGADDHLHQATNSLLITMCKKSDPTCVETDDNTFIMTIFQHKISRMFHAMYDPYVMLFKRTAPFEIHGMSKLPFWINGRSTEIKKAGHDINLDALKDQSEQFYITAFNWAEVDKMYHGYLDDDVLLTFGIEDHQAAAMDVGIEELMGEIFTC